MIERALIAGGGTGGHVYPAVAVAEEILRRNPAASVTFVGTDHGMEARIIPGLGYRLETLNASRLVSGGLKTRIMGLWNLARGFFQARTLLSQTRPQVVLGMGGYASGPALLAAWTKRLPTAIQEQNATPGFTNRTLGRLVRGVYLGFPAAAPHFPAAKIVETGNPLRRKVSESLSGQNARPAPTPGTLRILIFGGSQGARFLNEQVPSLLMALQAERPDLALQITHQTGVADEATTRARYAESPGPNGGRAHVTVTPFIDAMAEAYADADLAICRAGALTIAELTAVGLPSILVPFPFAAGNHQVANGAALVENGAAEMVEQKHWSTDAVLTSLLAMADDPARLPTMSKAARDLARLDAAGAVVDALERLCGATSNAGGTP